MKNRTPDLYTQDILAATRDIKRYIHGISKERFFDDTMIQDAVMRKIEIIGEATKQLPDAWKARHTDIPWKQMAGMRDVLIHDYAGVSLTILWDTARNDVPNIERLIQSAHEEDG